MKIIEQIRYFNFGQTQMKVSICSSIWTNLLDIYMAIPWLGYGHESLVLELLECSSDDMEGLIPLPNEGHLVVDSYIEASPRIPYKAYEDGSTGVKDFAGLGRVKVDYGLKRGMIAIDQNQPYQGIYPLILLFQNTLNSLMALQQFYSVHAACAVIDGQGIMITGHSGKGKSTSSMALLKRGYHLVTDERALVYKQDNKYMAYGITDFVKVGRSGAARFFPELLSRKPIYEIDEGDMCFKSSLWNQNSFMAAADVHSILFLQQTGNSKSWLEPINPARVISEFLPVTIGHGDRYTIDKKFNFLMEFLRDTPCYRMYFGTDMDCFTLAVEGLVK